MNTIQENTLPESKLVKNQKRVYGWKVYIEKGLTYRIKAKVRHDDECGNGHNTFSITGEIEEKRGNQFIECSGGCIHEEIAKHFPELAPLIKWHLVSTDGPISYLANVCFLAGDRDCHGLKKGEFRQFRDRHTGLPAWILDDLPAKHVDSETKPAPVVIKYKPWGRTGDGKERDFNGARDSAVWPEATDEELSVEPEELKVKLLERLPALMVEFKAAVESLGFSY